MLSMFSVTKRIKTDRLENLLLCCKNIDALVSAKLSQPLQVFVLPHWQEVKMGVRVTCSRQH